MKISLRIITGFLMVFFVSMPLVSCGSDNDNDEPDFSQFEEKHDANLVGTWKIQLETDWPWWPEVATLTYIYDFSANGLLKSTSYISDENGNKIDENSEEGKWETNKNNFLFLYLPFSKDHILGEVIMEYRIDNNKLYFLGESEYEFTRLK